MKTTELTGKYSDYNININSCVTRLKLSKPIALYQDKNYFSKGRVQKLN